MTTAYPEFGEHASLVAAPEGYELDPVGKLVCLLDASSRVIRISHVPQDWNLGSGADAIGKNIHEFMHSECQDSNCVLRQSSLVPPEKLDDRATLRWHTVDRITEKTLTICVSGLLRDTASNEHERISHVLTVEESPVRVAEKRTTRHADSLQGESEPGLTSTDEAIRSYSVHDALTARNEADRQRVAVELHDRVGQRLSTIRFALEVCIADLRGQNRDINLDALEAIKGTIRDTTEQLRDISMRLMPSTLDHIGLLATFNWLVREFQQSNPHIRVHSNITAEEHEIPPHLKLVLYRIVEEIFAGASTDSDSRQMTLELDATACNLQLRIRDDSRKQWAIECMAAGSGRASSHLLIVRERVESSRGTLTSSFDAESGTSICATWSLADASGRASAQ